MLDGCKMWPQTTHNTTHDQRPSPKDHPLTIPQHQGSAHMASRLAKAEYRLDLSAREAFAQCGILILGLPIRPVQSGARAVGPPTRRRGVIARGEPRAERRGEQGGRPWQEGRKGLGGVVGRVGRSGRAERTVVPTATGFARPTQSLQLESRRARLPAPSTFCSVSHRARELAR